MQGHQIRTGAFGRAQGRFALPLVGPGGVQDDGLPRGQEGGRTVEQFGVRPGSPLLRVQTLAVAGRGGLLRGDAGQFLAEAVAAEQGHSEAVGQGSGERGLPAARQAAHQGQTDG